MSTTVYIKINNNLICDAELSVSDKFVLTVLESYAFNEQRLAHPKIKTIEKDFNISSRLIKLFLTKAAPKKYYTLSHYTVSASKFPPITFNNYILNPISSDYTIIPIELIRDSLLSFADKMILITVLMLSKYKQFKQLVVSTTSDIMRVLCLKDKTTLRTRLSFLKDNGYIKINSIKNAFQITPNMEELRMKYKSLDDILNGNDKPEIKTVSKSDVDRKHEFMQEHEIYEYYLTKSKTAHKDKSKYVTLQHITALLKHYNPIMLKTAIDKYCASIKVGSPYVYAPHNFFGHYDIRSGIATAYIRDFIESCETEDTPKQNPTYVNESFRLISLVGEHEKFFNSNKDLLQKYVDFINEGRYEDAMYLLPKQ